MRERQHLVLAVDTSASMPDQDFSRIAGELNALRHESHASGANSGRIVGAT